MSQSRLTVRPAELRQVNDFVERLHRHHKKVQGHRWSLRVEVEGGETVGVAVVGRPVARKLDASSIVEATRVCTDGTPNACSALYGAICRQQRAHGYAYAVTYILESESGVSLKAAGWKPVARSAGGSWSRDGRERTDKHPLEAKVRWECPCSPNGQLEL